MTSNWTQSYFFLLVLLTIYSYHSELALLRHPRTANDNANWSFAASFNCAHISRSVLDRLADFGLWQSLHLAICVWAKLFRAHTHTHTHTHSYTQRKLLNNPCCYFTTLGISFGHSLLHLAVFRPGHSLWMLTFTLAKWGGASWAYNFNAHCRK